MKGVVLPEESPFSSEQRRKTALEVGVQLVGEGPLLAITSRYSQRPSALTTSVKDTTVGRKRSCSSESEVQVGLCWASAHYCCF